MKTIEVIVRDDSRPDYESIYFNIFKVTDAPDLRSDFFDFLDTLKEGLQEVVVDGKVEYIPSYSEALNSIFLDATSNTGISLLNLNLGTFFSREDLIKIVAEMYIRAEHIKLVADKVSEYLKEK